MEELIELIKIESSEMSSAFKKASIQGIGTPQEIADFREGYFQNYIRRYFPFPHRITKGKIRDSYGNISDSIDCLVLNPIHPYMVDSNKKFSIILADGVDVAIEVKPDIMSKSELERGLAQIQTVKKLRRRESSVLLLFGKEYSNEMMEYTKQIPSFIFSMKCKKNVFDTMKEVKDFYVKNNVPMSEWVDFIVINDVGIISNYKYSEVGYQTNSEGEKIVNFIFEEWKELTLVAFLVKLNQVYHSTPSIMGEILPHYLKDIKPYSIKYYG